jgi:hypothetical protein
MNYSLLLKLSAIAAITLTSLSAQPNAFCASVSKDDATAILGAPANHTKDPSGCDWEDATHKKRLNVAYVNVASMFERAKQKSATKGKTTDEKGLGGPAFSTAADSDKGSRVALYCQKGSMTLILDLTESDAAARLPQMRDAMRKLTPKE